MENSKHNTRQSRVHASTQETPVTERRGIKRPNPKLAELIRVVNLVPEEVSLPKLFSIEGPSFRDEPEKKESTASFSVDSVDLEKLFSELPTELQVYLRVEYEAVSEPLARVLVGLSKYEVIRNAREELYAFIDRYEKTSSHIPFSIDGEPALSLKGGSYIGIVNDQSPSGKKIRRAEVRPSFFGRAIDGAEVDYIRRCKICSKVFFAARENQSCCSKKCAKSQRQERWRTKRKEGYYQGANQTSKEKAPAIEKRARSTPKR